MVLESIFGFLTVFDPVIAVLIFATFIMILINIPYKFLINQDQVLETKQKIKALNKKSRAAQKSGDTAEVKKIMSESMSMNSKMMKQTTKPMIIGFIVVIVLLPFLHDVYGDVIVPENNIVMINGVEVDASQFTVPTYNVQIEGGTYNVIAEGEGVKLQRVIAYLPVSLPIFGNDLGWLGWYFIASIPLMVIIRKVMGINL